MKSLLRIAVAGPILLMGVWSCTVLPTYQPTAQAPVARLNLSAMGGGWMCVNGRGYKLQAGAGDYATIPAGTRVTIGRYFQSQGYNVVHSCSAAQSFEPAAGASYYATFELAAERCRVEIYREGAPTRIGLVMEPSIGMPESCAS